MLSFLLAAALLAADDAPLRVHVPNSFLWIELTTPGLKIDDAETAKLRKAFPNGGVFAGGIGEGVHVSVIGEKQGATRLTSAEWRDKIFGPRGESVDFEVDGIACREMPSPLAGDPELKELADQVQAGEWHAVPLCGNLCLDIHVSMFAEGKDAPMDRARFEAIVRSYKAAVQRRLEWGAFPPEVYPVFTAALEAVDPKAWLAEQTKAKPGDPLLAFVAAEVTRALGATGAEVQPLHGAASKAIEAVKPPTDGLKLLDAFSLDGAGLSLQEVKKHKESIAPMDKALKLATELKLDALRASLSYNLACSHAQVKNAAKAIEMLKAAIALDAKYKDLAKKDSDFTPIQDNKDWKALVAG